LTRALEATRIVGNHPRQIVLAPEEVSVRALRIVALAAGLASAQAVAQPALRLESPFAIASEPPREPEAEEQAGIRDNSFLIEEAFNQDPGVVQHIFNLLYTNDLTDGTRTRRFDFTFTQEWPLFSQTHQLSYTVPVSWIAEHPGDSDTTHESGVGGVALNYRYQALADEERALWIAPRFTVILPTGDENRGLGTGVTGYQINLPISHEAGAFAFHANAGVTWFPAADAELSTGGRSRDHDLVSGNAGASVIWIENPVIQPMLELVAFLDDDIDDAGRVESTLSVMASPGFRWAPYTHGSTQIVVGAAVPVGLTKDSPDVGVFAYFSIEHGF
jgi:hypothetical protein